MQASRKRWITAGAASLALVVAGAASVAAHPGGGDDGPFGFGGGLFRQRLERGGRFLASDGFVRSETTYQAKDGTVTTQRVDNGTVSAVSESSLDYTLATGETVTVTIGEDTEVVAFTTETVDFGRGFHRDRLVGESIAVTDIVAGSEVAVAAESQADGTFLAGRIIVQPTEDEAAAEDDAGTEDDMADDPTDVAPAASPEASPVADA
jgi:hypothetical protein